MTRVSQICIDTPLPLQTVRLLNEYDGYILMWLGPGEGAFVTHKGVTYYVPDANLRSVLVPEGEVPTAEDELRSELTGKVYKTRQALLSAERAWKRRGWSEPGIPSES